MQLNVDQTHRKIVQERAKTSEYRKTEVYLEILDVQKHSRFMIHHVRPSGVSSFVAARE